MHFKSAVVLCALYFVTVTQSIGLNGDQCDKLRLVFQDYKIDINNISNRDIVNIGQMIGMDMTGMVKSQKLDDLLVILANNDKKTDNLEKLSLSSYEVRLFVELFSEKDQRDHHNGLLFYEHVMEAVKALNLEKWTNDISTFSSVRDCIINEFKRDKPIDALQFLNRMWAVKPYGNGIDKNQVLELMRLHNGHKTNGDPNHIDPDAITKFFKRLSIVKEEYNGRFAFDSIRNSFLELQELLVVSAEYSIDKKDGTVYSTSSVRYVLSNFSVLDDDKDGLLGKNEVLKMILRCVDTIEEKGIHIDSFMIEHDTNEDKHLDIAEFFLALFEKDIELSKYGKEIKPFDFN